MRFAELTTSYGELIEFVGRVKRSDPPSGLVISENYVGVDREGVFVVDGMKRRAQGIDMMHQQVSAAFEPGGWVYDQPTRDGETEIYLWTTLPPQAASACTVARLYTKRWRIETAFQKLTVELRCEINTLGYPRAALSGFATAVVAFNAMAVVWAALRAVHGQQTLEQEVSSYYLSNEIANMAQSLETIIDAQDWNVFQRLSTVMFAAWLIDTAHHVKLRKYHNSKKTHVSTARLLAERKPKANAP